LSLLTGMFSSKEKRDVNNSNNNDSNDSNEKEEDEKNNNEVSNYNSATMDIRTKYASKLRSKVDGGLAGVELANSKKEESLTQGDAAGHFIARSIAASNTVSTKGSKWMASTGTGTLCSFLSNRSMKIALLPKQGLRSEEEKDNDRHGMELLAKQLPNVKFNLLGVDENMNISNADDILNYVATEVESLPVSIMVVSDQDAYLGSARDAGMYTCRVRRKNEPRGNITASYTVEDVKEVEDVVNELNGISFNTVFNQ
jgi:hypothetical protein